MTHPLNNLLYDNYPHPLKIEGHEAESFARALEQSPSIAHLNLRCHLIRSHGEGRLAEVLVQCPALTHLNDHSVA